MTQPPRLRLCLLPLASCLLLVALGCGSKPPAGPTGPAACTPSAGATCLGRNSFVELDAGDLPIVISVPHGGSLAPTSIPNRAGASVTDLNTIELGRAIAQALVARTGRAPHLVLCHLRRTKLDANRDVGEAAEGNSEATQAWTEYHGFVDLAAGDVVQRHGRGLYIDLHGHGHPAQRLELGYLLSSAQLDLPDAALDAGGFAPASSLRRLVGVTPVPFAQLLRGPTSLGGLLEGQVPAVPSPAMPSPGADPYFEGGYSTERHTATLPGLQIEANFTGVRDTAASRAAFAESFAAALVTFIGTHLGIGL